MSKRRDRSLPLFCQHDACALGALVRRREITPSELVEETIERIELWNPLINAVVLPLYDLARRRAAELASSAANANSPLAGVPLLLKDIHAALAGTPLTASCRFLRDYVPDHDSEVVARLRAAGLIFVARTNLPEFGIMGVTEPAFRGPTRNPWNLAHTPGGSSGGSAAAVAAALVPIAHGGDGGGSIRIPASCCGLVGLKPTRARIPVGPDAGESWLGLDSDGFITRSVRDSAALLDAVHGPDLGAPYHAPPAPISYLEEVEQHPIMKPLRIAFSSESLLGRSTHPDCRAAVEDAAALCESLGHQVEEARPRFDRKAMVRAYLTIVAAGVAHDIARAEVRVGATADPSHFEPETWMLGLIGRQTSAADLYHALESRYLAWREIAPFFETYDLLLTPTLAYPPQEIGAGALGAAERVQLRLLRTLPVAALLHRALDQLASEALEKTANTMLFNLTGQPAISLPLHWNGAGLPIGTQFVGRFGAEDTLLRFAAQLEEARPWWERRPTEPGE
jgi:amidase